MSITATVRINRFREVSAKGRGGMQAGVNNAARRIVANAQSRARRRTNYMADSTHMEGGGLEATVVAPAHYSGYMNWGTVHVAADYWFSGAVDEERSRFGEELREILSEAYS
jgi:hypothetical protein